MVLYHNGKKYFEFVYAKEEDLEKDVVSNAKMLFGEKTIYIDYKRKVETGLVKGAIPDGFLFDLKNFDNPEFYIIENELKGHDFFNHIFPQITKFFSFFKNQNNLSELVEKLFSIINNDNGLKEELKKHLGNREIYKFIKDTIENSQNIILLIDNEKQELPEIVSTYSDTWGQMVKILIFKKFVNNSDCIFTLNPDFEDIEYQPISNSLDDSEIEESRKSEEYHLANAKDNVREAFQTIKQLLLEKYPTIQFNPQTYYISIVANRNIVYFKIQKKKIRMVIMLKEEYVMEKIHHHNVVSLSQSVQNFYNGECCGVEIENADHLKEILDLISELIEEKESE